MGNPKEKPKQSEKLIDKLELPTQKELEEFDQETIADSREGETVGDVDLADLTEEKRKQLLPYDEEDLLPLPLSDKELDEELKNKKKKNKEGGKKEKAEAGKPEKNSGKNPFKVDDIVRIRVKRSSGETEDSWKVIRIEGKNVTVLGPNQEGTPNREVGFSSADLLRYQREGVELDDEGNQLSPENKKGKSGTKSDKEQAQDLVKEVQEGKTLIPRAKNLWETLSEIKKENKEHWQEGWQKIFKKLQGERTCRFVTKKDGSKEMQYLKLKVDPSGQKINKDSELTFLVYNKNGQLIGEQKQYIGKIKYGEFKKEEAEDTKPEKGKTIALLGDNGKSGEVKVQRIDNKEYVFKNAEGKEFTLPVGRLRAYQNEGKILYAHDRLSRLEALEQFELSELKKAMEETKAELKKQKEQLMDFSVASLKGWGNMFKSTGALFLKGVTFGNINPEILKKQDNDEVIERNIEELEQRIVGLKDSLTEKSKIRMIHYRRYVNRKISGNVTREKLDDIDRSFFQEYGFKVGDKVTFTDGSNKKETQGILIKDDNGYFSIKYANNLVPTTGILRSGGYMRKIF